MRVKIKYKYQNFQAEAARCVTDVFVGQPFSDDAPDHMIDLGSNQVGKSYSTAMEGFGNRKIVIDDRTITDNVRTIQFQQGMEPITSLHEKIFTIEMETGTGKTYTYIKTMYELNAKYGWRKFIVVVPSIAIREGVYKSFQSMEEHFAGEYGKRIQYFIYNSKQLNKIEAFASDSGISVMIINTQAFNSSFDNEKNNRGEFKNKEARIIFDSRDDFNSRRPIDVISRTNPILIIDEPQSVLGANRDNATRKGLKLFNPLFMLLYSATHRKDDIYNMVYRLDAIDAYNRKLVKKIAVKGLNQVGTTSTNGFVCLEEIVISKGNPVARISFDCKFANGTKQVSRLLSEGHDLYALSGGLTEYENNYVVERIDGRVGVVRLLNGTELYVGDCYGNVNQDFIRRLQIKETIKSHIERERQLFSQHIKVLSLFFIDHVDSYRVYDGGDSRGKFAKMFEEEYANVLAEMKPEIAESAYLDYLYNPKNAAEKVHEGYFSKDKKTGHLINPQCERNSIDSNDESAFDLIMKHKERLLSFDEPVRFIFSHSALKEGWDNPNVFQICTLKDTGSEMKKRQEVGRGMRLCVNDRGERQDSDVLGDHVFDTNVLTVIASESYENFAKCIQTEMAEACGERAVVITPNLFDRIIAIKDDGTQFEIKTDYARKIYNSLIKCDYVDDDGKLTEKYFNDKQAGTLDFKNDDVNAIKQSVIKTLDKVFDTKALMPENARKVREAHFIPNNFKKKEFQILWKKINKRTIYTVSFESDKLIEHAITEIDKKLRVTEIKVVVEQGSMESISDRESLEQGAAMRTDGVRTIRLSEAVGDTVKYDLVGKLVENTGLTRRTIVDILKGISPKKFYLFQVNPEEFIIKISRLMNESKAVSVIEHIKYHQLEKEYDADIFTESTLRGKLGENAIESDKSLYDLVVVDSKNTEKKFAEELERQDDVIVYTKLPRGFYINTPMGHYNPDWAIVFKEGEVKHIYFVAETKGNSEFTTSLRGVEESKIECARHHFSAITDDNLRFDVVDSYDDLYNMVVR